MEENEYGLWGHIIDPEEAGQAARAAEQNGMQSGSNTEMSHFYYGGTTFSECFRDFLDTVEDYNFVHDHLDDPYDEDDYDDYDEEEEDFFPEIVDLTAEEIETMFEHVLESFRKKYPEE